MKRILLSIAFLLIAVATAVPGWATTYNIGPGQTYETFTALVATETLTAGDIVDGGGNTFAAAWIPDGSGTNGNVITLRNATIDGAPVYTNWSAADGSGEYGTNTTFSYHFAVIYDGVMLKKGTKGSLATGEFVRHTDNKIYIKDDPTGHTVKIGTIAKLIDIEGHDYINVDNIDFYGGSSFASGGAGVYVLNGNYINVTNSTFFGTRKFIDVRGLSSFVTGTNNIGAYGGDGLDCNASGSDRPHDIEYSDNFLSYVNYQNSLGAYDGEAVASTGCGNNYVADRNNISYSENGVAWHVTSVATGYSAQSNDIHHLDDGSSGVSGKAFACSGTVDGDLTATISGNISHDLSVINVYNIDANSATCRMTINNNTAYNYIDQITATTKAYVTFKNNIGAFPDSTASPYQINVTNVANASQLDFDNNLFYSTGTQWWRWVGGAVRTTLALYQSDSSQESNSMMTNPLFISTTDFRLRANSAAIRTGTGTLWNGIPCSIGAIQQTKGVVGSSTFFGNYKLGDVKNECTIE